MAMPRSASLMASASLTPSPVMATTWFCVCSACTMAFFWSGSTRPSTSTFSSTRASSFTSSGSSRASIATGSWSPVSFTLRAMAPTVTGLSPEITRQRTPCSRNQASVRSASSRIFSEHNTNATGSACTSSCGPSETLAPSTASLSRFWRQLPSERGAVDRATSNTRLPSLAYSLTCCNTDE